MCSARAMGNISGAISSSAVNVSALMIARSSRILAKMIMISALVCSSQPISPASPRGHFRIRPAS